MPQKQRRVVIYGSKPGPLDHKRLVNEFREQCDRYNGPTWPETEGQVRGKGISAKLVTILSSRLPESKRDFFKIELESPAGAVDGKTLEMHCRVYFAHRHIRSPEVKRVREMLSGNGYNVSAGVEEYVPVKREPANVRAVEPRPTPVAKPEPEPPYSADWYF